LQGIAIHPQHLSVWERFRGVSKPYDPDLDFHAKVQELRSNWEQLQRRKAEEHDTADLDDIDEDENDWSPELNQYFTRTSSHDSSLLKKPGVISEKRDAQGALPSDVSDKSQ
jgi:hypothetical protein